jgi:hypothetical protein
MQHWKLIALGALVLLMSNSADADVLITPAEARPVPEAALRTRGISSDGGSGYRAGPLRDPDVVVVSPLPSAQAVDSPFLLKVKFTAHGGSHIDVSSVTGTYLNNPSVDLTSRLKRYVSTTGVIMPQAEVPPGRHLLRIEVSDSAGRSTSTMIDLRVNSR